MNSAFGEVFLFLADLAWKSRVTIPVLVTTAFLIMDIRLQIEINIESGHVAAAELSDEEESEAEGESEPVEDLDEDLNQYCLSELSGNEDDDCSTYLSDHYDDNDEPNATLAGIDVMRQTQV